MSVYNGCQKSTSIIAAKTSTTTEQSGTNFDSRCAFLWAQINTYNNKKTYLVGKVLASGRKPCPQTDEKYGPKHELHLKSPRDLLTHLSYTFKKTFLRVFRSLVLENTSDFSLFLFFPFFSAQEKRRLEAWSLAGLEASHFRKMRTGVRRCPARYPYVAPAPRAAATVGPFGGSSSPLLSPIKAAAEGVSFKVPGSKKTLNTPRRISPSAPALAHSATLSRDSLVVGGWVFFLPIHWHLEFIICCLVR